MMFGTPIHLPIDLVLSSQNPEIETQMYGTVYSNWLTTKLETIHNLTRDKIQLSSKHMIKEYTRKFINSYMKQAMLFGITLLNMEDTAKSYIDPGQVLISLIRELMMSFIKLGKTQNCPSQVIKTQEGK